MRTSALFVLAAAALLALGCESEATTGENNGGDVDTDADTDADGDTDTGYQGPVIPTTCEDKEVDKVIFA